MQPLLMAGAAAEMVIDERLQGKRAELVVAAESAEEATAKECEAQSKTSVARERQAVKLDTRQVAHQSLPVGRIAARLPFFT